MYRLDLAAVRESANGVRLMANVANVANVAKAANEPAFQPSPLAKLAGIAGLAISHESPELLAARLMNAAMRACDYWQDSPQARKQMRLEIGETKPEHRRELLDHFNAEYP